MPVLPCIKLSNNEQAQLKALVLQTIAQGFNQPFFQPPPAPAAQALNQMAASFVTLYVNDQLNGCIGAIKATESLWLDVCRHSYSSAFEDSRFAPLTAKDLPKLTFTIAILSEMVPIANTGEQALLTQLQVGIDGLLIKQDFRSAVFLPSVWQSLTTPEAFLSALKQKGGWPEDYWSKEIELFIFQSFFIK